MADDYDQKETKTVEEVIFEGYLDAENFQKINDAMGQELDRSYLETGVKISRARTFETPASKRDYLIIENDSGRVKSYDLNSYSHVDGEVVVGMIRDLEENPPTTILSIFRNLKNHLGE